MTELAKRPRRDACRPPSIRCAVLEGVCAAMSVAFRRDDQLVSTYRNLGDALAKGVPLRSIMAELYGRAGGTSKGKGGAMHLHDTSVGFMTTTGIVGAGLPIAVGLALAAQLDGDDRLVVVTFGDGATSIGAFHEAMNIAALWHLPVIFLCQNNQWGEHTPIAEYAANTDLASRAASYGMTAHRGRRIRSARHRGGTCAVQPSMPAAVDGPVFVEAKTYRLTGHTGTADYSYVPADELAAAMERDPAPTFRSWLLENQVLSEGDLIAIEQRVAAVVDDAFAYAQNCAAPPGRRPLHRRFRRSGEGGRE